MLTLCFSCVIGLEWSLLCVEPIDELGQVLISAAGPQNSRVLTPRLRTIPLQFPDLLPADFPNAQIGGLSNRLCNPISLQLHTVFSSLRVAQK